MTNSLYPMTFTPVYKDYPWGGNRIPQLFNRNVPHGIYAESWEISDRNEGMSIIANGPLTGRSLLEIIQNEPQSVLGTNVQTNRFPLLIKLIDAKHKLSVQVHPNRESAAYWGGEAKTEMWYFLGDNDTQVYCGLKEGITREQFEQAITEGSCSETLRSVATQTGNAVFVPGGSVHAIDEGCLILEVQQNSNTTYRVYDWDRIGNDGKPRELHIEQALNVINWNSAANPIIPPELIDQNDQCIHWKVLECEFFRLDKLVLSGTIQTAMDGSTFHALFIAEGEAIIRWGTEKMTLKKGTSILIPAALNDYLLEGNATLLQTTIPRRI